ncbi:MAG: hypothetical protein U0414_11230 [Polyangiaceae bacterium]
MARVGSTKTSRSSVNRGSPCPATACPPIRRNRTRREISALKNSLQSRFSSIFTEPDPPQPLDTGDALLERHGRDVLAVECVGLLEGVRDTDDALDHPGIMTARARITKQKVSIPGLPRALSLRNLSGLLPPSASPFRRRRTELQNFDGCKVPVYDARRAPG